MQNMYVMSSKIFEKSRPTEKLGEQDVLLAPPITLLGEQLLPLLPPVPAPMSGKDMDKRSVAHSCMFIRQARQSQDMTLGQARGQPDSETNSQADRHLCHAPV